VYVQPFPPSGAQWQVSRDGGIEPQWRSDGKELFYISSDQTLMSVDVRATDTFMAATPKPLFAIGQATRIGYGAPEMTTLWPAMVSGFSSTPRSSRPARRSPS
jgi:hypothetical protein